MQKHKLYFRSVYGNANIKKIKVEFPYLNTFLNPSFNLNIFLSKATAPILVYYQTDDTVYGVYIQINGEINIEKICELTHLNEKVAQFLSKIEIKESIDSNNLDNIFLNLIV